MNNAADWKPTKFVPDVHGSLKASRTAVGPASRLIADRVAAFYDGAIPAHVAGDLLDLGCGHAPLYATYKDHAQSVTLVDWQNSLHQNPHLDYVHDLNEPLTMFADSSFDTIIMSDVLEHLARPSQLLAEARRVLRPAGCLLLNVPFLYWLHEQPHDYYRYTRFGLEWLLSETDLQVLSLTSIGGAPEVIGDITGKLLSRVPVAGRMLVTSTYYITYGFVASVLGAYASRLTREQFPLGYAVVARRPL